MGERSALEQESKENLDLRSFFCRCELPELLILLSPKANFPMFPVPRCGLHPWSG
jgi:hypothetical protein